MKRRTIDLARNKWRGILMQLGIAEKFLHNRHGPCPMCEGSDRFRWDNQEGNGGFFCNVCGAGNGFDLLMLANGWDFATAAGKVDEVVGNVEKEAPRPKADLAQIARMKNDMWKGAKPLERGDMAHSYLDWRVELPQAMPACLRFHPDCVAPGGEKYPALVALVQGPDGAAVNLHRTFLGPDGKADIKAPRAMMPGSLVEGSAVRLFPLQGDRLGIAEGIETAFAAANRFNIPTWSAINSTMLEKWLPPEGVKHVTVFGDCDEKFGGQAAAYRLAHKLAARHSINVEVEIPKKLGLDWADGEAS